MDWDNPNPTDPTREHPYVSSVILCISSNIDLSYPALYIVHYLTAITIYERFNFPHAPVP